MITLVLLLLVQNSEPLQTKDVFSSAQDMEELCTQTNKLLSDLKLYQSELDSQIQALNFYFETGYENLNLSDVEAEEYVSNPVNTYRMIERLSVRFPPLVRKLTKDSLWPEIEQNLQSVQLDFEELQKAATSIIGLQSAYNLNTDHMVEGVIKFRGEEFKR